MKLSQMLKATVVPWGMVKEMRAEQEALARYGEVPVPGEATLTLPAGEVKVSYREFTKPPHEDDQIVFDPPGNFELEIRPAGGGDPLELKTGWWNSTMASRGNPPWATTGLGTIEVSVGAYEVSVRGGELGLAEPTVIFG